MYAVDPDAMARFWPHLRQCLADQNIAALPVALAHPAELVPHWRDPALLLSQTCGYPFVTSLRHGVRYVATPRFRAPGCEGAFYRSAVMVRADETAQNIAAMAGRRAAYNSRDSQSGYNALRALVAPWATKGRFLASTSETGSHRASLRAVRVGEADLAAIDVVTLALVQAHAPEETAGLRVLCLTDQAPGLPFVTAPSTSDLDLTRLRTALAAACDGHTPAAQALLLEGVEVLPVEAYAVITAMQDAAERQGYPVLQ